MLPDASISDDSSPTSDVLSCIGRSYAASPRAGLRITRKRRRPLPSSDIFRSRSSSASRDGTCCVCARSDSTSAGVNVRHAPGARSASVRGPSRTRIKRRTFMPRTRATSRIWRLRPSRITIRNQVPSSVRSSTSTQAGAVISWSISTPVRHRRRSGSSGVRSTSTRYSLSTSKRGCVKR
ncbi:MAG: hypothetical protein AVDCRST_MAG93-4592 [uncultured Chloroflexia bacterium]|uniref:Uncharacterized protein n=1 Tax=uncultured Chloroflexia bacterium TaxID=1672391 RepID=A0A6J4KB15_9CHLR|nr:MAG: hypothetical protein AVDCRST_MAG93-4592 [uncultured Chloroflexia bacterium]